jgi:uncharacterized protein YjbI with pentapeptide repeats
VQYLASADLSDANLKGADLEGANLTNAKSTGLLNAVIVRLHSHGRLGGLRTSLALAVGDRMSQQS